jgi:hypothetical protein
MERRLTMQIEITPERMKALNDEIVKRVEKVRDLCSKESMAADWKALVSDEASRNHFLRMLTSVACAADLVMDYAGDDIPMELLAAYQGSKEIMRFVLSSAIKDEIEQGTLKLW